MSCDSLPFEITADELHLIGLDPPFSDRNALDPFFGFSALPSVTSDDRSRMGRHPRWSRHETLTLIEAKRVEEAKWSKAKEEREKGIETARANSDSKWLSVSLFCERMGVVRSAPQCRKRWCNLSADYKRIRDWQSLRDKQSFWFMSSDLRKENKLPGCFDREVFDSLEKSLGINHSAAPEMIFDSGRQGSDDGRFADMDRPLIEENFCVGADKEVDSPLIESFTSSQGQFEEKIFSDSVCIDGCEETFEEPDFLPGRKKRRRPADGDSDIFSKELCTLLENNSKILTSHMNSQNMNSHLDRTQRKEHTDSLVSVLGRLAQAFSKIAEKL